MKKRIICSAILLCMVLSAMPILTACSVVSLDKIINFDEKLDLDKLLDSDKISNLDKIFDFDKIFNNGEKDSHAVTPEQFEKAIAFDGVKDFTMEEGKIGSNTANKIFYAIGAVYISATDEYFDLMGYIPEYRFYKDENDNWKRIAANGFELDGVGVGALSEIFKGLKLSDCEYKDEFYLCQRILFEGTEAETKLDVKLQFTDGQLTLIYSGPVGEAENYKIVFYDYGKTKVIFPENYSAE